MVVPHGPWLPRPGQAEAGTHRRPPGHGRRLQVQPGDSLKKKTQTFSPKLIKIVSVLWLPESPRP